mgnify:CR=1 FL=1
MHLDVQDLKNFYYRSALGRAAQKAISAQVLKMWPGSIWLQDDGLWFCKSYPAAFL